MDTDKLGAFVAAAEAGSLTRGAQRLGVQLSTLSRQVADLEREVGVALLVRTGRGVRPTPAGAGFLDRARRVLQELDLAAAEARGTPVAESELRLSSPPDLARHLLPGVIVAVHRRHPGLRIESRAEVRRVAVLEEAYDAVIRMGRPDPSDLLAHRLRDVSFGAWVPPGVDCASPDALSALEHVPVDGMRGEFPARHGGADVRIRCDGPIRVATFGEAAEVAARSGRAALLPSFVAAAHAAAGRLVPALPDLVFPTVPVSLLRPRRHRRWPVLADLAEEVDAALAEAERATRDASGQPPPSVDDSMPSSG
jgi:DNA-binding transcriptional LysR family regulator